MQTVTLRLPPGVAGLCWHGRAYRADPAGQIRLPADQLPRLAQHFTLQNASGARA